MRTRKTIVGDIKSEGLMALLAFVLAFGMAPSRAAESPSMHGHGGDSDASDWDEEDEEGSDAFFLSAMIAHHRGAVDMAAKVLGKTKDPQVEKWAEAITSVQKKEIAQMESILKRIGGEDKEAAEIMAKEMTDMLKVKMSDDPDENFVRSMIPHHAQAIDMSLPVLVWTSEPDVRKLAAEIIAAQAREIDEFRAWLDGRGGSPAIK